ncbi:MAG: thioredoxin family protein [Synergistaceae bacterium]|nr:thioredoxin family protein [Synergistaceae bacterium]MBQ9595488.1 thioredoxin family protein [Synergistaceae bacterium]
MILAFYLEGCPYCRQARKALEELTAQEKKYQGIRIDWVEENQHPEISDKYDYYRVPCMFVNNNKIYEARPGESYDECRLNVRKVLDEELNSKS